MMQLLRDFSRNMGPAEPKPHARAGMVAWPGRPGMRACLTLPRSASCLPRAGCRPSSAPPAPIVLPTPTDVHLDGRAPCARFPGSVLSSRPADNYMKST